MKRIAMFICVVLLASTFVFAQEQDSIVTEEIEDSVTYKMNQKGDQFIKIGIMANIPFSPKMPQLKVGGSGTLGYLRFLNSNIAVGGDANFAYMVTIGDNIFTYIPVLAKFMYQFSAYKFEFPVSLGIGGAFQNYSTDTYFGLAVKPEVGAFFRYSPNWSFGLNSGLYILPQWCKDSSKNRTGYIMDVALVARYHF
ncbi:MAG: hypothetical protein IKZ04_02210 [Spirochaetaceae bacterium]|nr:hypothetical protein [Spirochaetaceae bacterium]